MIKTITTDNFRQQYQDIVNILSRSVDETVCDESTRVIKEAGTGEHRHFHNFQHFLDISNAMDDTEGQGLVDSPEIKAVMRRAALYHDIVYHQVDGLHESVTSAIAPLMTDINEDKPLETYILKESRTTAMAKTIFDLKDNHVPSKFNGGNELLSALYAATRGQAEQIPEKYQLAEMAIIEATIPFLGENRMTALANRLTSANAFLPEGERLTPNELEETMHAATHMSNIDVIGFRQHRENGFKDSDDIIRESMASHQTHEQASSGRLGFMKHLLSQVEAGEQQVFHSYKGVPSDNVLAEWNRKAERHIATEVSYLETPSASLHAVTTHETGASQAASNTRQPGK